MAATVFSVVGIVFSPIGIAQTKKDKKSGCEYAIIGLIFSIILLIREIFSYVVMFLYIMNPID